MNNLYTGNIVSFIDTSYFIELVILRENALLYKIGKEYIDVTDVENIDEYVSNILYIDKTELLSSLPVSKRFVDESSLVPYKKNIKQLIR